jgi:hypothetical protein
MIPVNINKLTYMRSKAHALPKVAIPSAIKSPPKRAVRILGR